MFFDSSASGKTMISEIRFKEFELANGLHAIFHKDNANPLVSVDIWYHVGSKDEDPNRTGFAHLFEHMMFQGSANAGKSEHFRYIQKAGGIVNGSTTQDRTNYLETFPPGSLELVLWLESDRMDSLAVTQENFDNQREVVKEEKRQRYDNAPYGSRFYKLFNKSFAKHPYGWVPIGSMDDLNNADLSYAQSFYRRFYAPNNAVLAISGDIDYDRSINLVEKYFADLKPSKQKNTSFPEIIFNNGETVDTIYDNVQLPALYIAYKIPGLKSNEIYAFNLLSFILGESMSSRLNRDLVHDKKIAKSVNSFVWGLELGGLFIISVMGFQNSDLQEILKHIDGHIDKVSASGTGEHELLKAKNKAEKRFFNRQQTTLGIADQLAYFRTFFSDTNMINSELSGYQKVSLNDIKDSAVKFLAQNNRVVLNYLPGNKINSQAN